MTDSTELNADLPESGGVATDAELLDRSREGDATAYAELYTRYYRSAVRVAIATASRLDPEDVCAEAFARVWSAIRGGGGPTDAFRPYLYQAVRNVALNAATRSREVPTEPDVVEAAADARGYQPDEVTVGLTETRQVVVAFSSLPERWRRVLWMSEVDGLTAADVGAKLGISANAAAALSMRAREGLRNAWLQQHVSTNTRARECDWVGTHLSAFVRDRVSAGQRERIEQHLDQCLACANTRNKANMIWGSLKTIAAIGAIGVGGQLVAKFAVTGVASAATGSTAAAGGAGSAATFGSTIAHIAAPLKLIGAPQLLTLFAGHQAAVVGTAASVAVAGVVGAITLPAIANSAAPSGGSQAIAVRVATPVVTPALSPTTAAPEPVLSPTVLAETTVAPTEEPSSTPAEPSPSHSKSAEKPTHEPTTPSAAPTTASSPTPTPSATPTPTPTPTPTLVPKSTAEPAPAPTATRTLNPPAGQQLPPGCQYVVYDSGSWATVCVGPGATPSDAPAAQTVAPRGGATAGAMPSNFETVGLPAPQ